MNTTVAHLFRQLRQIASERPECIKTELLDEVEAKATELAQGSRIEGPALSEVWRLVNTHVKPYKKLMPRIIAELKHWKCKDIKVTVANHCSHDFHPVDKDQYQPYFFAYNIECTRHVGGNCYFRVMLHAAYSDIMKVITDGVFDTIYYRLAYGTGSANGVEFPEVHSDCFVDRQEDIRNDIHDALWDYHRDCLWRANANDEWYLIHDCLEREYSGKTIEEMNERLAYSITPVQEYLKSHTLLDGYTTAPIAIQKVIYNIRRSKHKIIPKKLEEYQFSPVVIHNDLDPQVELFDPQGRFVGVIKNITALYDVKLQIRTLGIPGYYMIYGGQKINIDQNGEFEFYPNGFFDAFGDIAAQLV